MITRRITRVFRGAKFAHVMILIFILGFIAAAPPWAQADIPRYINYQGKLTDAEDNPVTGDVSVTIRIYDAESGGTALWTEKQTVTAARGVFSMLLGESEALDSLDFNDPYWYSVEVEDDGEMTPRQRLTTIAYAINADKLDGYDAADFLMTAPGGEMSITGGANEDITLDPTGLGNIVMNIDSTSGDFKITDGTTNWVLVDSETGNVTIAKNLTVNGTIYGTLASTGGDSTFSSIVVTGTSNLQGNISSSAGAVTVADVFTQTGAANQVTFGGNVDANSGLDVTGALTVSGATTLSSALDMNSNIDLDYTGNLVALDVTHSSTLGTAAAQFSGGEVLIISDGGTRTYATEPGDLYVQRDLEVNGTIYGNVSSSGTTSLGDTTLSSLVVSGTSDLQGNVDVGAGIDITGAANFGGGTTYNVDSTGQATLKAVNVTETDTSTSGTVTNTIVQPTFQDGGTDSTTTAVTMDIAPTINYTGSSKTGSYTALKITATETSLPTGSNYLIDAYAGDGTSQKFYLDNSGNAMLAGTLNMSSNKITNLAEPVVSTDAVTKNYADAITPATAGGWTDGGTGVYLLSASDNVGVGTTSTDTYKLNVSGSTNTTSLYINGTEVTATAAELNIMDGVTATATEINLIDGYTGTTANLNTITAGAASNADTLHTHAASSLTGNVVSSVDGVTNDGGDIDLVAGSNIAITPDDAANTITIAATASGDETGTSNLTFTLDSDGVGTEPANGAGLVIEGGSGTDVSLLYNSTTNDFDIAGITGGLDIPSGTLYKINGSQIAASNLSDGANIAHINAIETISADWVNTANPWSDDEVADDITASNYLPLAGGAMTGDITLTTAGTNIVTSGIDLDLSPASGYGITSTVTRSADTGDEVAYNLAATISKAISGNYTGIKLDVTEASAPGASDSLLDLQVGSASKFTVDNAGLVSTASVNSASVVNDSLTAADLNVNVVSSLDGVTNDGGDIDLVAGTNITITPDDGANTITISGTDTDTQLNEAEVEGYIFDADNSGTLSSGTLALDSLSYTGTLDDTYVNDALTIDGGVIGGVTPADGTFAALAANTSLSVTGDSTFDTTGAAALSSITQSDNSASVAIATDTSQLGGGASADSDGVLKLGINEGNYQYIWYDANAGTDANGAFVFSDQAVIPSASPATLNFTMTDGSLYSVMMDGDPDSNPATNLQTFSVVSIPNPGPNWLDTKQALFDISTDGSFNIYDPTVGDAVFQIESGGRLAHDFRNLIKNGSFEAFSGFEAFMGYDPTMAAAFNNTTDGYRGGWDNFSPDGWLWVSGKIVQHSPALFTAANAGTYNMDFYDGKSAVALNEPEYDTNNVAMRGVSYTFSTPDDGKDAAVKQTILSNSLEPNTWYSIGAAMMVTNAATTKAILDIKGGYQPTTNLTAQILSSATLNGTVTSTISVSSTSDYPTGGTLLIDSELFSYIGKTSTSFTSVTRGINSTANDIHNIGTNNVKLIFKPIIGTSTTFEEKKGMFKTLPAGGDIEIFLMCQQTSGAIDTEFARFDAIQLIQGKMVPKFAPTSIVDIGDQAIYGTLRLGRSADGRGGILAVDQFIRTRGIDFFSDDPGMSGSQGGGGSVGMPYSIINTYSTSTDPKNPGTVFMDTLGNYIDPVTRKYQVRIQGTYTAPTAYVKYRYADCTDPMRDWDDTAYGAYGDWMPAAGSGMALPLTAGGEMTLDFGIKVKFSDIVAWDGTAGGAGYRGGDQWEFKSYGSSPDQMTYDSFNKDAAYKPSGARIFKDPETGELTFEDSSVGKVKLSQIVGQQSTGYISPPNMDPYNQGTVNVTVTGDLNNAMFSTGQSFNIWTEWEYDTSGNLISPPTKFGWNIPYTTGGSTYNYYGNYMIPMNRGSAVDLITQDGQNTGLKVTFPAEGTIYNNERWNFYASPGSAANIAAHTHADASQGGELGAPGTTSQNFSIGTYTDSGMSDIALKFGQEVTSKNITWETVNNRFNVGGNINISGALTATNIGGVATEVHTHSGADITAGTVSAIYLPTAAAASAGIIPSTGLTDVMVSGTAAIATSKLSGAVTSITNHGLGSLATLSAVSGGTITDGTITNDDIANTAGIVDTKLATISTQGKVSDSALSSNVVTTEASQTLSNKTFQPSTDVVSLTVKGKVSGTANVLSIYDSAASPAEKIYVDSSGDMHIAADTSSGEKNSNATLYFGRNATDDWETMGYDAALGTTGKGMFTFSAPLQVEASSPTGITFVEKDAQGVITQSQGFMYDPSKDEFSFTGGKLKQTFQNLIRNGSFESYRPTGWDNVNTTWGTDMSIVTDSAVAKFGTKYLKILDNTGSYFKGMKYRVEMPERFFGDNLTISIWARATSDTAIASIGYSYVSTDTNATTAKNINLTTTWQNFKWTFPDAVPSSTTTTIYIYLYGAGVYDAGIAPSDDGIGTITAVAINSDYVYFDGITLAQGNLAMDYEPMPIRDTGNQVLYGNLAIGANSDPTGGGSPTLVFGEPDSSFYYTGYTGWDMESGQISYEQLGGYASGRFMFNKPIRIYPGYSTGWGAGIYLGESGNVNFAYNRADAYIQGKLEVDGGIYGNITGNITGDADTIDTFHAAATPQANKLLALGADSKFSLAAIPQGTESTLDADLLDGQQGSYYMPLATDNWVNTAGDTMTGSLALNYDTQGEVNTLAKTATAYAGVDVNEYDLDVSRQLTKPASGASIWSGAVARIQNLANIAGVGALTDNTAVLELNQASTGNTLVLKSGGTPVVTFAKTGDITLGAGADRITSAGDLVAKLGDAAGANKFLVEDSNAGDLFMVLSNGSVRIGAGYTGSSGTGITLEPDGDLYFAGNLYQGGTLYTVDSVRFTGNYDVALISRFGVGENGNESDYLRIDADGYLKDWDDPVTVDDAFTQLGSDNLVTFQGNVDATNGLDVTGAALTTSAGLTVSGGTLSLVADSITDAMVSDDLTASNLVSAASVVSDAEVDDDITIASTKAGSFAGLTTTTLAATGDITGSATKLDIDKSYTNSPAGELNDHTITRNLTLNDGSTSTITGGVLTINAVDTQTSGTLTDNSTLLKLQTGVNAGSSGYFIDAQNSAGASKFKVTAAGAGTFASDLTVSEDLYVTGNQIISGTTLYDSATTIRVNSATALLVEKSGDNGSGADVLIVNTAGDTGLIGINKIPASGVELDVSGNAGISGTLKVGTNDAFQVAADGGITSVGLNAGIGLITTSGNITTMGSGVMTSAGLLTASAGISISGGNLAITDASNIIVNTNKFTLYGATGNATMAGTLTQLRSIGLTPEYDNATLQSDGSDNFGTLSLKYSNSHNYYEWTTNEPLTQDYDIVLRHRLPDGFTLFDSSPIKLWNKVSNATGTTKVTVSMLDTLGAPVDLNGGTAGTDIELQNAGWTESTITFTGTPTFNAGGYVTIIIKMSSDQGDTVDVGELTLKGNW